MELLITWLDYQPSTAELLVVPAVMFGIRIWRTGRLQQLFGQTVALAPLSFPPTVEEGIEDAKTLTGIVIIFSVLQAMGQIGWI